MPAGMAVLERLGLGEVIGGAPFYGVRYHFGSQTFEGRFPSNVPAGSIDPASGRGQRRSVLDQLLFLTASMTPGVTAHTDARAEAPLMENGRVTGLLVKGESFRGDLVVAADGMHSQIRHLLGLDVPPRRKRVGLRAHFRLPPGRVQPPWVDVFAEHGYEVYVTPLPEREVLVAVLANAEALGEPVSRVFERAWRSLPALASRLEDAEPVTPILALSPLAGRARAGIVPGCVLLGDAAGFLDPITGCGMTLALLTAELLAQHIAERSNIPEQGHVLSDAWLWDFERERRSLLRDYRILTELVLWFADHPRLAEHLLSALRLSPAFFSHLIGVSGGVRRLLSLSGRKQPAPQHIYTARSAAPENASDRDSVSAD
jgi:2-polyprenyl-6-methoxyphenol hydroxylase-like FAD-dependent oxidoreductase